MGTRLTFNIVYYPQTNRQNEKMNQVIKDMLKACCLGQGASWIDVLSLMKFVYNNSYQTTIQMALYEALYERKSISLLYQDEIGKRDVLAQALGLEIT